MRGLGKRTLDLRADILDILNGFDGSMSSRQVYYRLVGRGYEAGGRSYLSICRCLCKMRRDKTILWDKIVDRTRAKHQRPGWDGVADIMEATAEQYRRDLWTDQPVVPMIATEKHALEGIFSKIVDRYGVSLWVFVGFNSLSFEYEMSEEIKEITDSGKEVAIHYLGDHDPSGLSVEESERRKLKDEHGAEFTWTRIGLLREDIDTYDLTRVAVKKTDPRAKRFVNQFGDNAAELDSLSPEEFERRIRACIEQHIDHERWSKLQRVEKSERAALRLVTDNWNVALRAVNGRK